MPDDVDPQIQALLDLTAKLGLPKVQDLSTEDARKMSATLAAARRAEYPPPPVDEIADLTTGRDRGDVPVRVYRATQAARAPVIVYYHGGGHVIGTLDAYDTVASYLALQAQCTVVSVDYRMGPENPFPAAVEDAYDAACWVAENHEALRIDPARLAVCGDSAGANLAAVVALMARDNGFPALSAQVLIYPVIDYRGGTASYDRYGEGYGILETPTVDWFRTRYLPDPKDHVDWRANPSLAGSHEGLPPALVLLAECDVLHDEGRAYAETLRQAGCAVDCVTYPGMIHGFFSFLGLVDATARAHAQVAEFLSGIWARSG